MHRRTPPERWEDYCQVCRKQIYRLSHWKAGHWVHVKTEQHACNRDGIYNEDEVATPHGGGHA